MEEYPGVLERTARVFIAGDAWCLYLWGPTGGRKTSFAAAVLKAIRGDRPTAYGVFLPAYTAIDTMRNIASPVAQARLIDWRKAPVLVLDDLGKHRDTPHATEQMLFLLHYRYDWCEGHKTIVTSNISLDELAKRIEDATARRFAEGIVLEMRA